MPRKGKNANRRRKGGFARGFQVPNVTVLNVSGPRDVVKQRFTEYQRFVVGAALTTVDVSPVTTSGAAWFGPEAANMANLFEEFRLVGLEVLLNPMNEAAVAATSTDWAICWRPMTQTAPTSLAECLASTAAASVNSKLTEPVRFCVPRRMLLGDMPTKWLHIDSTPSIAEIATQGRLYYVAQGTDSSVAVVSLEIRSEWEFRAIVPFGQFLKRLSFQLKTLTPDEEDEKSAFAESEPSIEVVDDYVPTRGTSVVPSGVPRPIPLNLVERAVALAARPFARIGPVTARP
jgi:hypothetical protein